MVDPAGICPAAGSPAGRRLAVGSHDGALLVLELGADVSSEACAGIGAPTEPTGMAEVFGAGEQAAASSANADTPAPRTRLLIGTP
jgi:hypothetical protein